MTDLLAPFVIDICVCTFRRPQLAETLRSLAMLEVPQGSTLSIIVADNDETPSARAILEALPRDYPLPIRYIHAPARNISIARNACLSAATAPLVAFIDDDERATPAWLMSLVTRQRQTDADVILGPVRSIYPADCPSWLRRGDFHSIRPVWVKNKIITGYTSNVLFVREAASLNGLRFDPRFGRSGGEDTFFFATLHKKGGRIEFAADALVTEDVAKDRLSFGWLMRRSFRSGQTHGALLMATKGSGLFSRIRCVMVAAAKAAVCGIAALGSLLSGGSWQRWVLRGTLHIGVVARLLGKAELTQYG